MSWHPSDHDPEWPFELMATSFNFNPAATALLVIDLQVGQIALDPAGEIAQKHPKIATYWNARIDRCVIPNTRLLLDYFRAHEMKVVYTRNGYLTATGQETTRRLRPGKPLEKGYRGTPGYEIEQRVTPLPSELVVDKLTSGAFSCTWLDHALRNMAISGLIITGVVSDMCVLGTARVAAELGYDTMLSEDACASFTHRAHTEAMLMLARKFGRVAQTLDIIAELEQA